ncbi:MAG: protein kinase [Candidatus Eisenbacteria bacterium]
MPLTPGTRLGPYEVVAPLGAGGMGEVYRARDTRLGRDVALKVLPAAFSRDAERLARFRREAMALAALNHPNVAAIYGLEESGEAPCLVLELVEGETLAARLGRGALPVGEALALAGQVAAAVEAAHERSLVHRDLKPGNVMVTSSGIAKVLDFGLAKSELAEPPRTASHDDVTRSISASPTEAGVILGTAAYMSPEQARGRAVDRRSDVWSFGCVLYECLAGRPPFEGETVTDLLARILEREPDWAALPAATPPRVTELLRRCLRKNADERPRDIRDVRLELAEAASRPAAGAGAEAAHSLAVLPFENQGGADDEYFADGMSDEILNALAQLKGLRVAARSSSFAFKGRREDPRTVGAKLGVQTVLEGTVRRAGARLRVTVQLVNVNDGLTLWSERYDRELTDVFAVQDEIAAAISEKLRLSLGGSEASRHGTKNVRAYELFLKGRALQLRRGRYLMDAIDLFEQAVALDPGYAEALAWLADSWRLLGTFGVGHPRELYPKAKALAQRALALQPHLPEALATLADIEAQYEWKPAEAEALWQRTLALDPRHTRARLERALWGWALGTVPIDEALREAEATVAADPENSWALGMHSFVVGHAGYHAESLAVARRAAAKDEDSTFAQWNLVRALSWAGAHEEAEAFGRRRLASSGRHPWILGALAWLAGKLGRPEDARAIHDEMTARARWEVLSPLMIAKAACAAGLADEALAWTERGYEERDSIFVVAPHMPFFDDLLADPRVREVFGRVKP